MEDLRWLPKVGAAQWQGEPGEVERTLARLRGPCTEIQEQPGDAQERAREIQAGDLQGWSTKSFP